MLQAHELALVYLNQNRKPISIILHFILNVFQEVLVQITQKNLNKYVEKRLLRFAFHPRQTQKQCTEFFISYNASPGCNIT